MIDNIQRATRSPVHLLHEAEQAAERLFAANFMGSVTPRQLAVLVAVSENEGLKQGAVVGRTRIDRATIVQIIPRLLRKGLLRRQRSQKDARVKLLGLSDKGRQVLDAATPVAKKVDGLLLAVLPCVEREPFLAALQAIVKSLERPVNWCDLPDRDRAGPIWVPKPGGRPQGAYTRSCVDWVSNPPNWDT